MDIPSSDRCVELLLHYSNTPDILDDLRSLVKCLEEIAAGQPEEPREHLPVERPWSMAERLTKDQVDELICQYHAGKIGKELAEAFNISLSSVRRLLRKHQGRLQDRTEP